MYDLIPTISDFGKEKAMETVNDQWLSRLETGEETNEVFLGHETILYDTVMLDTLYHTFFNTCGTYNTKSKP